MKIAQISLLVLSILALLSCEKKGDLTPNAFPETKIVLDEINLSGDNRLNSVVRLSWFGSDEDGFITGYEISLDGSNWEFTTEQDSLFNFQLEPGADSSDISFYVRSIDDDDQQDPTPAELIVPLKNTPPTVAFQDDSFPEDSTNLVMTFRWAASDNDGLESVTTAEIKINDGTWTEFDVNQSILSIMAADPTITGTTTANLFYGNQTVPQVTNIDGFRNGDTNTIYLRVFDLANSMSEPDTSLTVFVKPQTSDLLLVSGESEITTQIYKDLLNQSYPAGYDEVNYVANGAVNQPKFWNPTFQLLINAYDKIVMHGDGTVLTNPLTGTKNLMLGFAAPHLQEFSNNNGKSLVINTFSTNNDLTSIASVVPMDSLSSSQGQAFIETDSTLNPNFPEYPLLASNFNVPGIDPFYATADAEIIYTATLTPQAGWTGPNSVAARRSNSNGIYQVFFSVPIYQFGFPNEQVSLLDQILNNDFNW